MAFEGCLVNDNSCQARHNHAVAALAPEGLPPGDGQPPLPTELASLCPLLGLLPHHTSRAAPRVAPSARRRRCAWHWPVAVTGAGVATEGQRRGRFGDAAAGGVASSSCIIIARSSKPAQLLLTTRRLLLHARSPWLAQCRPTWASSASTSCRVLAIMMTTATAFTRRRGTCRNATESGQPISELPRH